MPQHFMPVWWIAKDSLGIAALGIFSNVISLVKPRPKVQVRSSIWIWKSGVQAWHVALVSLDIELYSTLSLFIQVYKRVRKYCLGKPCDR